VSKLSVELQRHFFAEELAPQVTLADILDLAGERTFGFLFVILSLPSALPLPAPGYSTPFGILLFILAVQLIFGAKRPWFPQKWLNRPIELKTVQGFLKGGNSLVTKNRIGFSSSVKLRLHQFSRADYYWISDRFDGNFNDDSHSRNQYSTSYGNFCDRVWFAR
jgi:hypothetical protein